MKINWHKSFMNFIKRLLRGECGAVTMEYVLLCVLISGGAMFGVIAFSRTVMDMFHVASYMLLAQPNQAENALTNYREDRTADFEQANEWADSLHR